MQKLVSLAFSTLSTFSTTSQAFIQGHFRQTQRRVRREAVHGEPQVVNWEAASLEILQSATAYCAEGDEACDVEQLIDIKSALEGRAAGLEESAAAYADVVDCVEINQCVGCTSLSHFSAMTWLSWLGRAARNRHRHAIEQASRRWRGCRRDDSARTRRKILISTQASTSRRAPSRSR